jgi:imidazolonepropionase-like amidohydrolase
MKSQKIFLLIVIILESLGSCHPSDTYDLAIENVKIFDVYNGEVIEQKTILINNSIIESIIDSGKEFIADRVIHGKGRLVTPGFIDTHIHVTDMYGDYENAPTYLADDSVDYYRSQLTKTYLRYGTTTVMDMGQPENWMNVSLKWQKEPPSRYPNIYISGGAMISDEEREPYISHTEVVSPEDAENKVRNYNQLGLKHLKLYWRLREPEMRAIVDKAQQLNMHLYAHVDQNVLSVQQALSMGVKNFEHLQSIALSVFRYDDHYENLRRKFELPDIESVDEFIAMRVLIFKYIKEDPELNKAFEKLLLQLGQQKATLSTTIHLLGSVAERTYFTTSAAEISDVTFEVLPRYSARQKEMLDLAFDIAMEYLKTAHNQGVKIRIGTDCRDGGKALLSELMLLYEAGFPMKEILKIATINGADALFINDELGSVAPGKKADLLIFDNDPFQNHKHLLGDKIIIKSGEVMIGN